ncbi:MAG: transglycosylase domain-containing protein [Acidobacteriota bacterium]
MAVAAATGTTLAHRTMDAILPLRGEMTSNPAPTQARRRRIRVSTIVVPLLFSIAILAGALGGYVVATTKELPGVGDLETYRPNVITKVFADDGSVVGDFAIERRILMPYEKISPNFFNACIATEDAQFYTHSGINVIAIARAAIKNFRAGRVVEGGSTITQQLAKLLFLTSEQSIKRKLNEAILATQIERHYTKEKILEFYANKVYFYHGVYGVEAAAQYYFNKPAIDLTVAESATLAAMLKDPYNYAPDVFPKKALERRNHVLDRMEEEKMIDAASATAFRSQPIQLDHGLGRSTVGPYFVEEVRQHIEETYGADRLYKSGLRVYSTMNPHLQAIAEQAVRRGLHNVDKLQGWRGDVPNVTDAGGNPDLASYEHPDWRARVKDDSFCHALVTKVTKDRAEIRVGTYQTALTETNTKWIWGKLGAFDMKKALKPGDLPTVWIKKVNGGDLDVELVQDPKVEGALIAIEVGTGQVKAIVGGYDFEKSKFDRAMQAMRQVGSAFKPFVYTAAMDNCYRQSDLILDAPLNLVDRATGKVYSPHNYDYKYMGEIRSLEGARAFPQRSAVRMFLGSAWQSSCVNLLGVTAKVPAARRRRWSGEDQARRDGDRLLRVPRGQGVRLVEPTLVQRIVDVEGNVVEDSRARPSRASAPTATIACWLTSSPESRIRHGYQGEEEAREGPRRQDRNDERLHRRLVHRLLLQVSSSRRGRVREKKTLGPKRTGAIVALDLDGVHDGLPEGPPRRRLARRGNHPREGRSRDRAARGPRHDCPEEGVTEAVFQRGTEPEMVCTATANHAGKTP